MTEQRLPPTDMNSTSPLSSALVASRRPELGTGNIPMYHRDQPSALQHQIFQLKQQQQMQQQILLQQFHAQQQQLAEQHQKQLQDILEHQKKVEEEARVERERLDKERLLALKNKEKREQSAVASSEVKQKLQEFVLSKKQREAAAAAANGLPTGSPSLSSPQYRAWTGAVPTIPVPGGQKSAQPPLQLPGPGPGTSGSSMPHPLTGVHHYRHPLLPGSFEEDYIGLRKTASEPNLLKMRTRHRGMPNRRNDPIMGRRDAHGRHVPPTIVPVHPSTIATSKRMSQLASETEGSTPDSGASSPLSSHNLTNSHQPASTVSIPEREPSPQYNHMLTSQGSISDLSLYSSPSLPNISLGRPAVTNSSGETSGLTVVNESDVRATLAARMGLPLGNHLLHAGLPYYPLPPTLDGNEFGNNLESSAYIPKHMQFLEQPTGHPQMLISGLYPGAPITDSQVAHARLNKSGLRPLGRTQSAPLPLGHPVLHGTQIPPAAMGLTQQQFEQYVRDRQVYEQQQQHNMLKQQIRQTVLTRVGSRSQVENVEEETEAAVAREMSRDRATLPEVIDLTEHKVEEEDQRSAQYPTAMDDRDCSRDDLPLVPQRLLIGNRPTLQAGTNSAFTARSHHAARPLSRAFSSPLVSLNPAGTSTEALVEPTTLASAGWITSAMPGGQHGSTSTGLAYDVIMLRHQCSCGNIDAHPENATRLQSIMARLAESGLSQRCMRLRSRKATLEEIQSVHTEAYTELFGTSSINKPRIDESLFAALPMKGFMRLNCGGLGADSDTTWNDIHTPYAARMAAGCVIDLAVKAATGEIKNGFAVVRPPGHHAESQQAMGFCYFNSVAIAAKQLRMKHQLERVLIVDWDVHHGNGTQHVFYDDPHILYISIHRHDKGDFFPGSGSPLECGADEGIGFNVNIAWSGGLDPPLGDAEYLAAFRTLVMPIAQDFDPEIVLVSAGFDAAVGHPRALGGYEVSAACFGYMTRQLMQLASGKVILALEGGYDLPSICDASYECVRALLGDEGAAIRPEELNRRPCQNAIKTLHECITIQTQYWPGVKRFAFSADMSAYEAERTSRSAAGGEAGEDSETLTAMAGLSVCRTNSNNSLSTSTVSREPSQEPMDQDESK